MSLFIRTILWPQVVEGKDSYGVAFEAIQLASDNIQIVAKVIKRFCHMHEVKTFAYTPIFSYGMADVLRVDRAGYHFIDADATKDIDCITLCFADTGKSGDWAVFEGENFVGIFRDNDFRLMYGPFLKRQL